MIENIYAGGMDAVTSLKARSQHGFIILEAKNGNKKDRMG